MAIELEDRLIEEVFSRHGADGKSVLLGPGDDGAMVRCPPGEDLLITADTLNEGVHFPTGMAAEAVGHRALAVSLSDLAAMAARPLWAVVTLSVPRAKEGWLAGFADGLFRLADRFGVRVIGGDFVRGPLSVTVTAHGAARSDAVLRRNGAKAGHGIWVSGFLGDAAAGLNLMEAGRERPERGLPALDEGRMPPFQSSTEAEALIHQFCYPQPRVQLGLELAGIASACMDLSDGLVLDLARLLRKCELGARLKAEEVPLSKELKALAGPEEAMALAMTGGDDYELCFTVSPKNEDQLASLSPDLLLTRIGETHAGKGLAITREGQPWTPEETGFSHFP